ncbi:hypothetical protein KGF56_000297 [Candida oxycetoniae]|uniref:CNH domain-containing protein n=1 Tax=Candida oxycetoniae TaxID=497107 RepID=A0AAI9T223_9ASCO|nr:uncharacterized protein KGF56_000297 [Candida oxycetoniae]KAI3407004.2 hypothetical protein KGF56_000297 [Candida oxycetoniae]
MPDYQIDPIINEIPLKDDEIISAIESYERSVYIGTSKGNLLQFYKFEDAPNYMLITQQQIANTSKEVTRIVCLSVIQKLLVICDNSIEVFTLPEMAPFSTVTKLKGVRNVSVMEDGASILALRSSIVQVVRLDGNRWKIIGEIKFSLGLISTSPLNDMFLIANEESYFIQNIAHESTLPLFAYKSGTGQHNVPPHIELFDTLEAKEYLLTISSDENTSMAVFINSIGDVTRGTLTWVNHGYPCGGVAVEWPHVFAVFKDILVLSSLESLENILVTSLQESRKSQEVKSDSNQRTNEKTTDTAAAAASSSSAVTTAPSAEAPPSPRASFHIQKSKIHYNDLLVEELVGTPESSDCELLLFSERNVYALHRESPVLLMHKAFQSALSSDNFDKVFQIENDSDYGQHLLLLSCFLSEKDPFDILKKRKDNQKLVISPNLAVRLLGADCPYETYPGLAEVTNNWDFSDDNMLKKYLEQLTPLEVSLEVRKLVYRLCSHDSIDKFVDKDSWTNSAYDKEIIEDLVHRSEVLLASKAYGLMPNNSDTTRGYYDFLMKHLEPNLVDDAIAFLSKGSLGEKEYTDIILTLIKLNKEKIYLYMRKSDKYLEINRRILAELSDDSKGEVDFALIQIELLERSWSRDNTLYDELFLTICNALTFLYVENSAVERYFTEARDNYQKLNSLVVDKWPKIFWIDYLELVRQPELTSFISLYTKSFEMAISGPVKLPDHQLFHYHKIYKEANLQQLLEFGDFSTAEKLVSGQMVRPQKVHYSQLIPQVESKRDEESLLQIFKYYLKMYSEGQPVEPAIQHFTETYETYLPTLQLIKLLPDSIPLAFLTTFLKNALQRLKSNGREKLLIKGILKSEASQNKHLINDFS